MMSLYDEDRQVRETVSRLVGKRVLIEVMSGTRIIGIILNVTQTHIVLDTGAVALSYIAILMESQS